MKHDMSSQIFQSDFWIGRLKITAGHQSMTGKIFNMTGQICMTPVISDRSHFGSGNKIDFCAVKYYVRIFFVLIKIFIQI
jgi:hypothetical protein